MEQRTGTERSEVPSPEPRAKKRAQNRRTAEPHAQNADWAYDSERKGKACNSGRGAQRPGRRAERARKHDRIETAAAASERRDA